MGQIQGDDDFELVAIALEHSGAEAARPFIEQADATFPIVVDEQVLTSTHFGFKAVPNGVLVDGDGVVRYAKYGGFSIDKAEDVAAVERFLHGEDPGPSPESEMAYRLGPTERELVATKLRLGRLLASVGHTEEATRKWRDALHLDPANLTIRKQIWAVKYAEKFHPAIDREWQKAQLAREQEAEIAAGICGPDG